MKRSILKQTYNFCLPFILFAKCFIQLPNFYRFSDLLQKEKVFKNVQIVV